MTKDDHGSSRRAGEEMRQEGSATAETGADMGTRAQRTADRVIGGVEGMAHDAMRMTGSIAGDGVHVVREVTTDAVQAVGDIGTTAVRTASGLLVGLVEGIREVADSVRRRSPPPPSTPPAA